jgi:asparagine synthase (glutamine-hydrolysing)
MLYTDTMTYLPEELLVKVDRATMAHGLEARSPFLDHKVVEFVAKLPSIFKYRRGERKYLLKRAIESYLPEATLTVPRWGFPFH